MPSPFLATTSFAWRAFHNKLPTQDFLKSRGFRLASICPLCQAHEELLHHILFSCPYANWAWKLVKLRLDIKGVSWQSLPQITKSITQHCRAKKKLKHLCCLASNAIIYHLWEERNTRLFHNVATAKWIHFKKISTEVGLKAKSLSHNNFSSYTNLLVSR